jgi:hypothetical protein
MDMLEISPQLLKDARLSVSEMAAYLIQHGWQQLPNSNDRLMIFQGINDDLGNPIFLTLPRHDRFGDALRRLAEAVNLVAAIEDRSPESILVDIRDFTRTSAIAPSSSD